MAVLSIAGCSMNPMEIAPPNCTHKVGGAQCTVQTGTVRAGGSGASIQLDGSTALSQAMVGFALPADYPTLAAHDHIYIAGTPAAGSRFRWGGVGVFADGAQGSGSEQWLEINVKPNAGGTAPTLEFLTASTLFNNAQTFDVTAGAWHCLQWLVVKPSGVVGGVGGNYRATVKWDDVVVFDMWDFMSGDSSFYPAGSRTGIQIGQPYSGFETLPLTNIYHQNVCLFTGDGSDNTGWPGNDLNVVRLAPSGAGVNLPYVDWIAGTAPADWSVLDESPEATDFVRSGGVNRKEAWVHADYTDGGAIKRGYSVALTDALNTLTPGTRPQIRPLIWDGIRENVGVSSACYGNNGTGAAASSVRGTNWAYDRQPNGALVNDTFLDALETGVESTVDSGVVAEQGRVYAACVYVLEGAAGPQYDHNPVFAGVRVPTRRVQQVNEPWET